MKSLRTLSVFAVALSAPLVALAAAPRTFQGLANVVANILNNITAVLIVAGMVVYFWGISINILKFGEGDREKFKNYFLWGIIVLFVMVSVWGIVYLLQATLFGGNSFNATNGSPQAPVDQFRSPQFLE